MRIGTRTRLALWASAAAAGGLLAADLLFPFPYGALTRPPSVVVEARDGTPLGVFLAADGRWRMPVRLDEVSPTLVRGMIASEDRGFRWHPGVDPLAIARALAGNLAAGRRVSGASTIPMQIARMAERRPRTLRSKAIEAFRALQLTLHYSKDELLEIYLNLVPQGGNLEGVAAASWFYFGKLPSQLSDGEAALLVALPRAPTRYDPVRRPAAARAARARVLAQLASCGVVDAGTAQRAAAMPLPAVRKAGPRLAPHFAVWAHRQAAGAARVRTTLDPGLQRAAEQAVASRVGDLRRQGVGNAAAVVLDADSRDILAFVGAAAFDDPSHDGEVNGALAPRSPGSALKPFLYATAIDDGTIVPESFLLDVPTDYGGYVPENFDGTYRGRVTAREALVGSLNAPAVRLLSEVGVDRFRDLLRRGGLASAAKRGEDAGLPLVLGAVEVRLLDLVDLYATLGRGGEHRPVRWRAAASAAPAVRILSREAAWLVTDMLEGLRRPDFPEAWALGRDVPAAAWKTGTSYGHKDAWAVGFTARHAAGVWAGNPDGRGMRGISGAEHAAPLLFDLLRAAESRAEPLVRPEGLDLAELEVCADSHERAEAFCPRTVTVASIPGRTRLRPCSMHRRVFVDAARGERLAGTCLEGRSYREQIVAVDPPELVAWKRANGLPVRPVPAWSASCRQTEGGRAPRIVSPDPRTPYRLRRGVPSDDQRIALTARTGEEVHTLWWYQDGTWIASAPPGGGAFARLAPGAHRLVVVDDQGRADEVVYHVE